MRKRELSSKSLIRVEGSLFTTMDTKTICEVVAWIKAHEDLLNFFQDDINTGGSPSEVVFEFCANRTSVYPYPKKCQEKVPNGCRFVYLNGPAYKQLSDRITAASTPRPSSRRRSWATSRRRRSASTRPTRSLRSRMVRSRTTRRHLPFLQSSPNIILLWPPPNHSERRPC